MSRRLLYLLFSYHRLCNCRLSPSALGFLTTSWVVFRTAGLNIPANCGAVADAACLGVSALWVWFHGCRRWLQLIRRTSAVKLSAPDASSHPLPAQPIAALRPRLAKAQTLFMSAAGMEPQWLRGGWGTLVVRRGCYWFEPGAWGKAAASLQLLLTR